MKKENREFHIQCPYYTEKQSSCPGSNNILSEENYKLLMEKCVSEDYKNCKVYSKLKGKAA